MEPLITITYECAVCGEQNESIVEPSAGLDQTFSEDCAVCCRTNVIRCRIREDGEYSVYVDYDE